MLLDSAADIDVAAVRRQNRGVNTDQLTVQVHQRAAGVTAVNRGVGLNKVLRNFTFRPLRPSVPKRYLPTSPFRPDQTGYHWATV